MSARSRLCYLCGGTFPDDETRRSHMATDHPAERIEWRGKVPYRIGADGTEARIAPSAIKRYRRAAGGPTSSPPPDPFVTTPTVPSGGDDDAGPEPPRLVQAPRPRLAFPNGSPVDAPVGAPSGPILARDSIREALPLDMLADLLRQASVAISEADGAGEAGTLTRTEAATVAMLLYDSTIGAVERYFGGDVARFKLGLAVLILAIGKGRIHARAILSRQASAGGQRRAADEIEALAAAAAADVATEIDPDDPIAALAARQRAWAA